MKTTLVLLVLLCSFSAASSQDIHYPVPITFSQPQLVETNQQSKFFYSWNWSCGPSALNQRYHNNAYHTLETFNN